MNPYKLKKALKDEEQEYGFKGQPSKMIDLRDILDLPEDYPEFKERVGQEIIDDWKLDDHSRMIKYDFNHGIVLLKSENPKISAILNLLMVMRPVKVYFMGKNYMDDFSEEN